MSPSPRYRLNKRTTSSSKPKRGTYRPTTIDAPESDPNVDDSGEVIPFDWYNDQETDAERRLREKYLSEKHTPSITHILPSEWTEFAIQMPHKSGRPVPFSFEGREYMRMPYDIQTRRLLLFCGRQVEKSTLLGNSILARMCLVPFFRALYVSPTHRQTKTFRDDRIGEPIAISPVLQSYRSHQLHTNQSQVQFAIHSMLTLRYAYLTADRVRGIRADIVYIDEIQDILTSNLPVIEECASHGDPEIKMFVYSGTPKTFSNTIHLLWERRSTQNEWAVPCTCRTTFFLSSTKVADPLSTAIQPTPTPPHASSLSVPAVDATSRYFWNAPLGEAHLGKKGLICTNCGGPLHTQRPEARWVSMNSTLRNDPNLICFEGFRIPQLMVPWIPYNELLDKRANYSRARFCNEVLAESFDHGSRPLRMADVVRSSSPDWSMRLPMDKIERSVRGFPVFMGIDWGTGENSYTVLTMGGYFEGEGLGNPFFLFYMKRYEGVELEPEVQMYDIFQKIDMFKPRLITVDYGGGFIQNKALINRYGANRVLRFQYVGGNAKRKKKIEYDGSLGRFLVERSEVMGDMFNAIRDDKIGFPRYEDWADPFAADLLNIYSEYVEATRSTRYDKPHSLTDDTFHSMLYCFFGSMALYPRPDVLRPMQEEEDKTKVYDIEGRTHSIDP